MADNQPTLPPLAALTDASPATLAPAGKGAVAANALAVPGYEILKELGRGGMGVVYQARHLQLGRIVALKMILGGAHAGSAELARFLIEAEAVAHLQHAHIVQLFDSGHHGGLPYFTLEYVAGGSLADRVRGQPLPAAEGARLVEQLARGIAYAHACGIVHRDLKPENVLLTPDGTPKITDFGLAKRVDSGSNLTATGAVMGTPSYMAPEQASGKGRATGPAADIYALGALLYRVLTGRPPFQAATALDTLLQVVDQEPVPPRQLQPQIPRDLETITLKCLQKEPARRYGSALALAEDLRRFQAGEPIAARPVGGLERGWRWCRRNPAVATLAATVLLTLLAGIAASTLLAIQAGASAEEAASEARRANDNARLAQEKANLADERAGAEKQARAFAEEQKQLAQDQSQRLKVQVAATAQQLELARATLFTAQLARVDPLALKNPANALVLLHDYDACPIDRRDAAWHYYNGLCQRERPLVLPCWWNTRDLGVNQGVIGTFSEDGRLVAFACKEGKITIWRVADGQLVTTLHDRRYYYFVLAFSRDGQWLAGGTESGTLHVWHVPTGTLKMAWSGHAKPITNLAFDPAGRLLASSGQDGSVCLWNPANGQERGRLNNQRESCRDLVFTTDGKTLVVACNGWINVWQVESLKLKHSCRLMRRPADPGDFDVAAIALSPDDTVLASALASGSDIQLWDLQTGRYVRKLEGGFFGYGLLQFSGDGKRLLARDLQGGINVCDVASGQLLLRWDTPREQALAVRLSGDGMSAITADYHYTLSLLDLSLAGERAIHKTIAVAPGPGFLLSNDGRTGATLGKELTSMVVWDSSTGKTKFTWEPEQGYKVAYLAISDDGSTILASFGERKFKIWDVLASKERAWLLPPLEGPGAGLFHVSANGRWLARTAGNNIEFCDLVTGKVVWRLKYPALAVVTHLALSPDATSIAICLNNETLVLLDAADSKELRRWQETDQVFQLQFSPNGQVLAISGGRPKLIDVATGRLQANLKITSIFGPMQMAFSGDSKTLALGGIEGGIKLCDVATGEVRANLARQSSAGLGGLAFHKDGRALITLDYDGTLRHWNLGPASPQIAVFYGQIQAIDTLSFSADDSLLCFCPNRILGWNTRTGQLLPGAWPFNGATLASFEDQVFNSDYQIMATRSQKTIDVQDANTYARLVALTHSAAVVRMALSKDGNVLAAVGDDRAVVVWETSGGKLLGTFTLPAETALSFALTPDGRTLYLPGGAAGVRIVDVATGKERGGLKDSLASVRAVAVSADGKLLAAGCNDGTIQMWDLDTLEHRATLRGHYGAVTCLAFHPDGGRLASGSTDLTVQLWDVAAKR